MKKLYLFILFSLLSVHCHSQISFEKGYFIDNINQKIDCLIKNIDWKNSPTEFEYKLLENGELETKTIAYVKEFGVYGKSKYIRHVVEIDRSSGSLGKLSTQRNPVFKEERLFFEVLIEGKASLFLYEDGSLRRFFFTIDDSKIDQLVYKSYKISENEVGENNHYRQQLWKDLKCQDISMIDIEHLNYRKGDLINFFTKFNECSGSDYKSYIKTGSNNLFNLTIRPGVNASALTVDNSSDNNRDTSFDTELGFRFGLEAEFIMPFNRNKWAVIIEPTYRYYESEKELERFMVKANYKSIELPVGIRHYMFLNEESKLFLDAAIIFDFTSNSIIDFDTVTDLDVKSSPNLAIGLGYKFNDKYSLELRYHTSRDILRHWITYDSSYRAVSVIIGYSIF